MRKTIAGIRPMWKVFDDKKALISEWGQTNLILMDSWEAIGSAGWADNEIQFDKFISHSQVTYNWMKQQSVRVYKRQPRDPGTINVWSLVIYHTCWQRLVKY